MTNGVIIIMNPNFCKGFLFLRACISVSKEKKKTLNIHWKYDANVNRAM